MADGSSTPGTPADAIVANIGREVTYPPIRADGARRAAEIILNRASPVDNLTRCSGPVQE